jgi:hypothetical protein
MQQLIFSPDIRRGDTQSDHLSRPNRETEAGHTSLHEYVAQPYYAIVPATLLEESVDLLDQIISFAFGTLGASRLELCVRDTE